ncbi:hypothetical protein [Devosia sp. FJ2-5-3]|uniref:hypothetical protein n=1 Tax=Devosia sp. FJ2-5-3 TaxID=2976680 RepID=UPI0023D80F5A|nr:hypothetical protein [Devosia sp. FJ2-5-3]WEJ60237.1 hypothetical protein N0P34_09445 [Devosia sp. FJ2-5-3]
MAGIDARTGKVIDGLPHIEQSISKLVTTALGERIMREWVGNPGLRLIGQTAGASVILQWVTIVWALVELFEPRFRIRHFAPLDMSRDGVFDLEMVGEIRPYAHLDWQQARFFITIRDGAVVLAPGT